MHSIILARYGKIGYQLFAYMLAYVLCKASKNSKIYAQNYNFLDIFNLNVPYKVSKNPNILIDRQDVVTQETVSNIVNELQQNTANAMDVLIVNAACNIRLYENCFDDLKLILANSVDAPTIPENKILINLNYRDEILNLQPYHTEYIQPSLAFYKKIVEATGLLPVFSGVFPRTKEFLEILDKGFPGAEYLEQGSSANYDFELIRRAKNKVVSVSTFSYLAAYFGDNDTKIHMPLYGFLNPKQRPDINLIPSDISRFTIYDDFPVARLNRTSAQISELLSF